MRLIDGDAVTAELIKWRDNDPHLKSRSLIERWVRKNGINVLIKALAAFPTIEAEQKWIPVTERMPESMTRVLCACRANIIEVLRYDHVMDDWDTTMPNRGYMKGFVTHWMPLPKSPDMDGGAEIADAK